MPAVIQSLRPALRALTMGAASFRAKRKQRPQTEGSESACSRFAAAAAALVLAVAGTAQADVVIQSGFPSGPGGNWSGGSEGSFSSATGTTATWSGTFGSAQYKWVGGITPGKSYKIEFTANVSVTGWGPVIFGIQQAGWGGYMRYYGNQALFSNEGVFNNDQQWQPRGTFATGTDIYTYATTGGVPWTLAIDGTGLATLTNSLYSGSWSFSLPQSVDLSVGEIVVPTA